MGEKIAVYMQADRSLVSFTDADQFTIYEKQDCWTPTGIVKLDDIIASNMTELRKTVGKTADKLGDCKIIAGKELTGIAFSVFDRKGFDVFEIAQLSNDILDGILEDIKQGDVLMKMKENIIKNAAPVETDTPGMYWLDLIELQTQCPEVSSKKALKDFLDSTPFLELALVCKHIPPWLETLPLDIKSTKADNDTISAVITRKRC